MRFWGIAALAVASFALVLGPIACGSGDTCEEYCSNVQDCGGLAPDVDCGTQCAETLSTSDTAKCSKEYDALLTCTATLTISCTPSSVCDQKRQEFETCIVEYCKDHPTFSGCRQLIR